MKERARTSLLVGAPLSNEETRVKQHYLLLSQSVTVTRKCPTIIIKFIIENKEASKGNISTYNVKI